MLDALLKMLDSENETDAALALKSLKSFLSAEDLSLPAALTFAFKNVDKWHVGGNSSPAVQSHKPETRGLIQRQGMPECHSPRMGEIYIDGEMVLLTGAAADASADIALCFKDAIVAAVINKTRFKIKLQDVKQTGETHMQAEYERDGMAPVRIWYGQRGEVAAAAAILRQALKSRLPEISL